jgi:hypothetical protein
VARDAAGNSSPQASLQATTSACSALASPPSNRYTDINFAAGKYDGEGIVSVFEADSVDARLHDGFLPPEWYDDPGAFGESPPGSMTLDPNQRVYLFNPQSRGLPPNPQGSSWASWQELRTTDGPWYTGLPTLAKATLNMSNAATHGPQGFSFGAVRWFAWDYLLPLNINGVSFEIPNSFFVAAQLHDSGGTNGNPAMIGLSHYGNTHPQYIQFAQTPDQSANGVPYLTADLLQITNADGSRITSAFNTWHEVVVGIRFAADSSGWVEVWHDGVQKLSQTFRANIAPNEGGPYAEFQNYTSYPTSFVGGATRSAIVYGGFRAGTTRAAVQTR